MTTEPTREEVASFLHSLEQGNMAKSIAAECARAWLALHDAPIVDVLGEDSKCRLVAVEEPTNDHD